MRAPVVAFALVLLLPLAAAYAPLTADYVGPGDAGLVSIGPRHQDVIIVNGQPVGVDTPGVHAGGARFVLPAGATSASVVVVDDLGFELDIVVCQDPTNNPALCRRGVSPVYKHACQTTTVGVNSTLNLFVFVLTALDDVNGCDGYAPVTTGTITVTPS